MCLFRFGIYYKFFIYLFLTITENPSSRRHVCIIFFSLVIRQRFWQESVVNQLYEKQQSCEITYIGTVSLSLIRRRESSNPECIRSLCVRAFSQ